MKGEKIRQRIPKLTSEMDENVKIRINSCNSKMDRIELRASHKTGAARLQRRGKV